MGWLFLFGPHQGGGAYTYGFHFCYVCVLLLDVFFFTFSGVAIFCVFGLHGLGFRIYFPKKNNSDRNHDFVLFFHPI